LFFTDTCVVPPSSRTPFDVNEMLLPETPARRPPKTEMPADPQPLGVFPVMALRPPV
jgi:hypothetical protein